MPRMHTTVTRRVVTEESSPPPQPIKPIGFKNIDITLAFRPLGALYLFNAFLCCFLTYFASKYFLGETHHPRMLPFLAGFILFELFLSLCIPGFRYYGPADKAGFAPKYKDNAVASLVATLAAYVGVVQLGWIPGDLLYANLTQLAFYMAIVCIVVVSVLWVKARFAPNSETHYTGDPVEEIYCGAEIYPYFMGVNIKHFCNCRVGMMLWPLILTSCMYTDEPKGYDMYVSYILQMVYLTKFYYWEKGYMNSLDIILDHAGLMVVGGCLSYVPVVYTSPLWLIRALPTGMSREWAAVVFLFGLSAVLLNYLTDLDKQIFRESGGKRALFPNPTFIQTDYRGRRLLTSGFWGLARHINYLFELSLALAWSCPYVDFHQPFRYYYFLFLCVLLVHRNHRDYNRCFEQYHSFWLAYCKKVPYSIIPYLY